MMRFRPIERHGTKLAVAVGAATILVFQPFHYGAYLVQEIESRYHLDLLPGLTVLAAVFIFQEYCKRQEKKKQAIAIATKADQACSRSQELERLMAMGQALGTARDRSALLQVLWRYLPAFANDREFWAL